MIKRVLTHKQQEKIQGYYQITERGTVPLGVFKNLKLTKDNFKAFMITEGTLYEFTAQDFEYADIFHIYFKIKNMSGIYLCKNNMPKEVIALLDDVIEEENRNTV